MPNTKQFSPDHEAHAPIAVFAFNRPGHLSRTLTALAANNGASKSSLTIFCDGPRNDADKKYTDEVRHIASNTTGFAAVHTIFREENMGCATSIITGVSEMFAQHEEVIVIEDDILCSPYTLTFLNQGLHKYRNEAAVFNIAAWSPPPSLFRIPKEYPYDVYCIPRFNCWGWASWRDRWEKVDWEVADYEEFRANPCLHDAFNQGGTDLAPMLFAQMLGKLDTWDVRVDYARFRHGLVGVNPVFSYTTNIGMGSGTHTTTASTRLDNDLSLTLAEPRWTEYVFIDKRVLKAYQAVHNVPPLWKRAIKKVFRTVTGKK